LQERGTLADRATTVFGLEVAVVVEPLLITQELLPGNVPRVSVRQNNGPVFALDLAGATLNARGFTGQRLGAGLGSTVDIDTRVRRVVEDVPNPALAQRFPNQLTVAYAPPRASGKEELMVSEVFDHCPGWAQFIEQVEDEPYGCLNLFVGIEDDLTGGVVDQPGRQAEAELAFLCLLQFAPQETIA
jgi:hypothetical protein